jgi:aldose 1-epimerase
MVAIVALASGAARADVIPSLGGAVAAFQWRGRDVMRHTPAQVLADGNVRLCASFPLVPFSNRIEDAQLRFDGATYALHRNYPDHPHAIHGVGFQRPWQVVAQHADRVTLAFDYRPEEDERRGWPFAFRARQSLALREQGGSAALTMSLALENTDARAFPFGLGWHPYFPRTADTVLSFAADGLWETGPTLLPERHIAVPPALSFDPPRAIATTALDNVFTGVHGAARLDYPDRGMRVIVEGDRATPFLVVFIPSGRDFCALEPVTHMTDAFNRHARGEAGTGTRTLAPGAGFSCTMRILAQPLGDGPA